MPFIFLHYLQPTHYFRLFTNRGASVFPKKEDLPKAVLAQLNVDLSYVSELARDYDLSFQALELGYIENVKTYEFFEAIPIFDNYHFIRKHFHPAWVFYILLIRLLSFQNPFIEVQAWWATVSIKKQKFIIKPNLYPDWKSFQSELIKQEPLISVVIPTLNRYDYLNNVLKDFEKQDYCNFEVIVVDQSEPFEKDFYKRFKLNLIIIRQDEKALWLARNTAIKAAKGNLIALSEDDVRIQSDWLSNHLRCLDYFNAEVSAGVFYPEGQEIPNARSYFAIASQFATGNAMLYKSVFSRVGLFDRQFEKQRMGDAEFGLRVYLSGIRSISNPFASCIDIKAETGGLREMGSWDAFRPSTFFAPRPIPSVLYYFRNYFGNKAALWTLLRTVPLSIMPYQFKKNKPMLMFGVLLSIMLMPLVLWQVWRSWSLATKKLEEGPLIEEIK